MFGPSFFERFVAPRTPVVVRGRVRAWPAIDRWDPAWFARAAGWLEVPVKTGDVALGSRELRRLADHVEQLYAYENAVRRNAAAPGSFPYLHDVPIFHLIPQVCSDCGLNLRIGRNVS